MTPLPSAYQPGGSGTVLQWRVYTPTNNPDGSWPAVLLVHGGGFSAGSPYQLDIEALASTLAANGYSVFVGCYRLAPCNRVYGQVVHDSSTAGMASGRVPQQTDDVMFLTQAARADSRCNGKLALIGSSSGGTLTTYVGLYTGTISGSGRPTWHSSDRPDCVVSFSGVYDLSDQQVDDDRNDPGFVDSVQNYTNTCTLSTMLADSPISLISGALSSFKPLYMVNSVGDATVPGRQIFDMACALENAGANPSLYTVVQVSGDHHALSLWNDTDPSTGLAISTEVLNFLSTWLN